MGRNRERTKGRKDAPGGFAGIPRYVMDHPDYKSLSGNAVKVLMMLAYQYKGKGNGNLTAAWSIAQKHGFRSEPTLSRAIRELMAKRLIIRTREGRFLNPGGQCALYALAWKPIDECPGKRLEVGPTTRPPRQFSIRDK
ncbi:MAG: hypothetical protein D9N14_04870 [Ketobacter sp.]|nr:MAG: hypothetical protein D9N14_04870 [Ketobacter sp.]